MSGREPIRIPARWAWLVAALTAIGVSIWLYAYQQSREEEIELMLRTAVQQFRAGVSTAERPENPETDGAPRTEAE